MRDLLKDFLEVNIADFEREVQECKNPSLLSKLLEVALSIQKELTERTQINLVSNMVLILEKKIQSYSNNNKNEKDKQKLIPTLSLTVLLILLGETVVDIHNFIKKCK